MILKNNLKEEIRTQESTIIFECNEEVILRENNFGVISLLQHFGKVTNKINVYDKLVGKGAALLLMEYNVDKIYAKTITKEALVILQKRYTVEYDKVVQNILNRHRNDLCPIEKIAHDIDDVGILIEELNKFYKSIGVFK